MTTVEDLIRLVEEDPTNPIVAAMLVDELMDARDMNRKEADDQVNRVQAVAVQARDLREATKLMRAGTTSARQLGSLCRRFAGAPRGTNAVVIIVAGDAFPTLSYPPNPVVGNGVLYLTATVGARWLLLEWQQLVRNRRRDARARRIRRAAARR